MSSKEVADDLNLEPPKPAHFWLSVHTLLIDLGLTFVVTALAGAFLGAAGLTYEEIINHDSLLLLGALVSVYAAYVMYKRISASERTLIYLVVISLLYGAPNIYIAAETPEYIGGQWEGALLLIVTILSLAAGWGLAKHTSFRLYIPPKPWLTTASVLGFITVVIMLLTLTAIIAGT